MARSKKNNCDYFPHFTTMRNHKKIKALRSRFGQVLGYAFWSMFVEYLTEQDGMELENTEIELEMFSGELGETVTVIRDMLDYCIKIELLFINQDNFIYSDSLNENLQPVFEKRKRAKESSKTRIRRENGVFSDNETTTVGQTVTETPQSKVDKSKVDKIISPIPPKGDDIGSNWKENYDIYLDELRISFVKLTSDSEWISQQEEYNSNVDIPKSIEKACVNYWSTKEGWKKKKRSKIIDIDWKSTFANAVSIKTNRVYKQSYGK